MRKEVKQAINRLVTREWEQELMYQMMQPVPDTSWLEDMANIVEELDLMGGALDRLRAATMRDEMEEKLNI